MKFEASLTFSLHQKGALATRPGPEIKAKPRCCQDIVLQCNVYLSLSTLRLDSGAAVLLCLNQKRWQRACRKPTHIVLLMQCEVCLQIIARYSIYTL